MQTDKDSSGMGSSERRKKLDEHKQRIKKISSDIEKIDAQHETEMQRHKEFLNPRHTPTKPPPSKKDPPKEPDKAIPVPAGAGRVPPPPITKQPTTITKPQPTTTSKPPTTMEKPPTMTKPPTTLTTVNEKAPASRKSILKDSHLPLTTTSVSTSSVAQVAKKQKFDMTPAQVQAQNKAPLKKSIPKGQSTSDEDSESSEEILLHVLEILDCLEGLRHIFMQRLIDVADVEAAGIIFRKHNKHMKDLTFQIFSIDGELLFLMEQITVRCTSFIIFASQSYQNTLYDTEGNKVLKFYGPTVCFSRMISNSDVTDAHGRVLGYIKTFGNKRNYSVYNARGERLFLVLSNTMLPSPTTTFTIICRGKQIGLIKYGWKHTFHEIPYIDYETAGVEIPPEMDTREKALLMACMILLEFSWFSPYTKLKISTLFGGLTVLILSITILVLPLILDPQRGDGRTREYYAPSEMATQFSLYAMKDPPTTAEPEPS